MRIFYQVSLAFHCATNKSNLIAEDGLVSCPLLCGRRMKEEVVFPHLDVCQKNHPSTQPKQSAFGYVRSGR